MKILHGVCGEGLGHAIRSKILIDYLKKKHDIIIAAGGRAYSFLSKHFDYVEEIEWPKAIYRDNTFKIFQTGLKILLRTITKTPQSYFKIKKIIKQFNPDVVIIDAEPICCYAALFNKIRCVSIDNPHSILFKSDIDVKLDEYIGYLILKLILKISIPKAEKYIIYDFFDEKNQDPHCVFVKPIIQEKILAQRPSYGNYVFVYQTSISNIKLIEILKEIDEKFIIYGFNKDAVDKNFIFKKFNENDFYRDIANAKAIITNGGFTVLSEALYLKKPIFSIPIKNQFEQMLNAKMIKKLGVGVYYKEIKKEYIINFLNNLENYKRNFRKYNPGNQTKTLELIEKEIFSLAN
jgi:uncharacterized protein (TIGR00661 family)